MPQLMEQLYPLISACTYDDLGQNEKSGAFQIVVNTGFKERKVIGRRKMPSTNGKSVNKKFSAEYHGSAERGVDRRQGMLRNRFKRTFY